MSEKPFPCGMVFWRYDEGKNDGDKKIRYGTLGMNKKPIVYLLCGLPGSGKTTYAKKIEEENVIRLSLDEELFSVFGKKFSPEEYSHFEKQVKSDLLEKAILSIKKGDSVVLDWGFWKKEERDNVKNIFKTQGVGVKLIYFKKGMSELEQGVFGRDLSANHEITAEMMKKFVTEFQEPVNEGEEII